MKNLITHFSQEIQNALDSKILDNDTILFHVKEYQKSSSPEEKDKHKDLIFESISKFILSRAYKFSRIHGQTDLSDLFDCGVLGFLQGLDRFDTSRKVKFLNYVGFWIQNEMYKYMHSLHIVSISKGDIDRKLGNNFTNNTLYYFDKRSEELNNAILGDNIRQEENIIDSIDSEDLINQLELVMNSLTEEEKKFMKYEYLGEGEKITKSKNFREYLLTKMKCRMNKNSIRNKKIKFSPKVLKDIHIKSSSRYANCINSEIALLIRKKLFDGESFYAIAKHFTISQTFLKRVFDNQVYYTRKFECLNFTEEDKQSIFEIRKRKMMEKTSRGTNGKFKRKENLVESSSCQTC